MLFRTRLYMKLNSLCGSPRKRNSGDSAKCAEEYFRISVDALGNEWSEYSGPNKRGLVIGCGGGEELSWLAPRLRSVSAVDTAPRAVERASQRAPEGVTCQLVPPDSLPFPDESFDVIFMHNVCEHIIAFEDCFSEYHRVLRNDGVVLNSFAPLFYSPYGAHLTAALKLPWGHLIFGLRSVLELRNIYYPSPARASCWEDLGLNRITEPEYRREVVRAGFEIEKHRWNTSKRVPIVGYVPFLRDLFIVSVFSVLRKRNG